MAYQGDQMYMQPYDASADNTWTWQGQQTWGNSYDQIPYDQSQYDYQQQGWDYQQQWAPATDGGQASQEQRLTTWATAAEAQAAQAAAGSMAQQLAAAAASSGQQQGGETEPTLATASSAGAWVAAASSGSPTAEQATAEGASQPAASGQQTSPSLDPTTAEPYAGAELLTELRLAELKRLIDRDAQALKKTSTADAQAPQADAPKQDTEADALKQEPEGGITTAEQDSRMKSTDGAALARRALQETTAAAAGGEAGPSWRGERRKAREKASASPPGLAAPTEQCHLVLVDFDPDSRTYGEMPVRAGEEVAVSHPPVEDWIFGWKRGPTPDQGWLPSQCLGIGVSISDADTTDEDWEEGQAAAHSSTAPRRKGGRGRGGAVDGMPNAPSSGSGRRSKGAEKDGLGGGQQKADDEAESEAWHHHGNWWSRQRHLKQESAAGGAAQEDAPPRQRPARQLPPAAAAAVAAATADKAPVGGGGKASGRGKGQVRERAALSSLLDRLNKPLVAPTKPAVDTAK